jgi:hypothetical protein
MMSTPDFKGFADEMIQIAFEGSNADGAAIQEIAERYGLLRRELKTEPCCEECQCALVSDFPLECYVRVYL